jgi:fatty-acyl-CoA synthase
MGKLSSIASSARQSASDAIFEVKVLREAGILALHRPDKSAKVVSAFLRWGASPALGITTAAIHYPDEVALIDERGSLTFEQLHRRSNALAHAFAKMGIGDGDGIGIMCRNHRGFIEVTLAAAKIGASALYLNTMFAGPQLVEVTAREAPKALVYDEEFTELLGGVDEGIARIVGWTDARPGRRRGRSDPAPTVCSPWRR